MDPQVAAKMHALETALKKVPYQYQDKARLQKDVAELLRTVRTLSPQVGEFSGGSRKVTLFYLYGVLPISYSGATYNIPVTIYFDPPYPNQPPRCFVTPSTGMALKTGHPHIDANGMIYIPYLSNWSGKNSKLTELATYLISTFSSNPPVYATGGASSASRPSAVTAEPAHQHGGVFQGLGKAIGGLFGGEQPAPQPPQQVRPPVTVQAQPLVSRPVTAQPVTAQPVATVTAIPLPSRKEKLLERVAKGLGERWEAVLEPLVSDVNRQTELRAELEGKAHVVVKEAGEVRAAAEAVAAQSEKLRASEEEMRAFISANAGREVNADELREELDADKQQVLDCLAEEQALEEFLVGLDELLAAKKISLEDFLREVRDVSRRQFMCRMLRNKCMKAVGVAPGHEPATAAPAAAPVVAAPAAAVPAAPVAAPAPAVAAGARRQLVAA